MPTNLPVPGSLLLLLLLALCVEPLSADRTSVPLKWKLCKADTQGNLHEQGAQLSTPAGRRVPRQEDLPRFESSCSRCFDAAVPGTILANLVRNGTYGADFDPYFETNLASIPDINATGPDHWLYYYVADFDFGAGTASANVSSGSEELHALLELRSINYHAEVWFDGQLVAPPAEGGGFPGAPRPSDVRGMFRRFFFPLGPHSTSDAALASLRDPAAGHRLAILVHPPPNPGSCDGGQGGSHDLAKDGPISQCAAGWDWVQGTPDRNTGLWDRVTLSLTGPVQVRDPTVQVLNVDPAARTATLNISATLYNRDALQDRCVTVAAGIRHISDNALQTVPEDLEKVPFQYFMSARFPAGSDVVSVVFPPVHLAEAHLWYPHTHGSPELYEARVGVFSTECAGARSAANGTEWVYSTETVTGAALDDDSTFQFGVRKVEPAVSSDLGGLQFLVNDEPVFLNGGNWIFSDQLLRFAGDPTRAFAEVGLHRAMGLNLIRVWGGGITERPEFFEACDKLGIFVFQEFWMTGDNNGRWAGSYDWPLDHALYVSAVRDTMLLLRNHPSLLFYDGGNELYPTSKNPPPSLLTAMQSVLEDVSPGTFFIVSSMTNSTGFDPSKSLAPRDGPYTIMAEEQFYERNPNLWDWHDGRVVRFDYPGADMPFQPEIGSVSHPVYRSLLNFMAPSSAAAFPGRGDTNVHPTWTYHKFIGFTPKNITPADTPVPANLVTDHVYQYGAPQNTSEYCLRAQLAQFAQYRALFESYQAEMWRWYSAAIFWKSQGPWPALRGAFYDWYMAPTGGYYGARAALVGTSEQGSPFVPRPTTSTGMASRLHAQMNLRTHTLSLVAGARSRSRSHRQTDVVNGSGQNEISKVCVAVRAFELGGSESGALRWWTAHAVQDWQPNTAVALPNSTIPWAGGSNNAGSVLLYRVETFAPWPAAVAENFRSGELEATCSASVVAAGARPMQALAQGSPAGVISRADYWLSDWMSNAAQDYSILGRWRDNTASHVSLTVGVVHCGSTADAEVSQCDDAECIGPNALLLTVSNRADVNDVKDIAFGVVAELHYAGHGTDGDSRVLPTFYSDGLFALLPQESARICVVPGPGIFLGGEGSQSMEIRVSGWNVRPLVVAAESLAAP